MTSEVQSVSQDQVAHWAALNTDLLFFHELLQVWVKCQVETVTYSLGSQQNGIVQVLISSINRFSSVENDREWSIIFHFVKHHTQEVLHWRAEILLIDHVETYDHSRIILECFTHIIYGLLAVRLSQYLQSADNKLKLEKWVVTLHLFLDTFEDGNLRGDTNLLALVIDDHTENVSQLQDENLLLDEDAAHFEQDLLEKLIIVVEIASQQEFWLEGSPDRV